MHLLIHALGIEGISLILLPAKFIQSESQKLLIPTIKGKITVIFLISYRITQACMNFRCF